MMSLTLVRSLSCAAALVGAVYAWQTYATLPETMGTHFRGDGIADGFSSRESFYTVYAVLGAVFLSLMFGTSLLRLVPSRFFNLPRKEYWLAPERRAATIRSIETYLACFVAGATVFGVIVFGLVVDANRRDPPRLDNGVFLPLLIAYLAWVLAWLAAFLLRFLRRSS